MGLYAGMDKKTFKEYIKKYPLYKTKEGLGIREAYNLDQRYGKGNWNIKGGPGYAASEVIKSDADPRGNQMPKQWTVYSKLPEPKPPEQPKVEDTPVTVDPESKEPAILDVNEFPAPPTGPSPTDTLVSKFQEQIAAMQQGFMQSMQQQQMMFQEMQASQNERMEALQQQMLQTQIAQQPRPEVAGVKMATGAAGTPMQIARRGVTGAFGRRGMRISSLNV